MAVTIDEVLARRTRVLLLDAKVAINSASVATRLIAEKFEYDEK